MKIIIKKLNGERLDKALTELQKKYSRSQIQKLIKNGLIFVNAKLARANLLVREGDEVNIKAQKKLSVISKNKTNHLAPRIVDETQDYLVVKKPAGLLTHGAPHLQRYSLADWLVENYPNIKKVGDDPWRPGIVHRLDQEVEGLMIVALNNKSFEYLKNQFQKRLVKKVYEALVYGSVSLESGLIELPIKRSSKGYKMAAIPKNQLEKYPDARRAITFFKVLKRFRNFTLLEIEIKTGRTHQIRAHLGAIGHPVVGDKLYGNHATHLRDKKINTQGLMLAALELEFNDLQGERKGYKISLPNSFTEFISKIKH